MVMAAPVTQKKERAAPGKYPITTIGVCTAGLAGARGAAVEPPTLGSHACVGNPVLTATRVDASPLVGALVDNDVGRDCGRIPGPSGRERLLGWACGLEVRYLPGLPGSVAVLRAEFRSGRELRPGLSTPSRPLRSSS